MSANNYISINKKTFRVEHRDMDTDDASETLECKSLEEAIEKAEDLIQNIQLNGGYVEYGISFEN